MSGLDKLFRAVRKEGKFVLSKAKIKSCLKKQETYSLHRGIIRKQKRQKIVVPYIDYQWEIDTAYMTTYAKQNDGYAFFYAYHRPIFKVRMDRSLKNKSRTRGR